MGECWCTQQDDRECVCAPIPMTIFGSHQLNCPQHPHHAEHAPELN